jgi:hypothetical protein
MIMPSSLSNQTVRHGVNRTMKQAVNHCSNHFTNEGVGVFPAARGPPGICHTNDAYRTISRSHFVRAVQTDIKTELAFRRSRFHIAVHLPTVRRAWKLQASGLHCHGLTILRNGAILTIHIPVCLVESARINDIHPKPF